MYAEFLKGLRKLNPPFIKIIILHLLTFCIHTHKEMMI